MPVKQIKKMVTLQWFDGENWVFIDEYSNALIAWITLGPDTYGYRVIDKDGNVLKQDI